MQSSAIAGGRPREAEIAQEIIQRLSEEMEREGYTGPQPRKREERPLLSPFNPVMVEATQTLFELAMGRTDDSVDTSAPPIDLRLDHIIGDNVAALRDVDVDYWLERAMHGANEGNGDTVVFRWLTAHIARWMACRRSSARQEADAWEVIARTAEQMGWIEEAGEAWRAAQIRSAEAGNRSEAQRRGREAQRYGPHLSDDHPAGRHQTLELTQIVSDCLARRISGDLVAAMPDAVMRTADVLLQGSTLVATADDARLTLSLIPNLREPDETLTILGIALAGAIVGEWVAETELAEFAWFQAGTSARRIEWYPEAIAYLDRATTSLGARAGDDAELIDRLAMMVTERGLVYFDQGEHEQSMLEQQEAVDLRRPLVTRSPEYVRDLLLSLINLAISLRHVGRNDDSLKTADEAVELANRYLESQPDRVLDRMVSALSVRVNALQGLDRFEEILPCTDRIRELCDQIEAGRPDAKESERAREWRSEALVNRAVALRSLEKSSRGWSSDRGG